MTNESARIIKHFKLLPHPEGGWFREVYRSDETIAETSLPDRYNAPHTFYSSIYFLLENTDFSAFHRIRSDETWHFYMGSPVLIYCIYPNGSLEKIILGQNFIEGQVLQFTIPRNCWFAAVNIDADAKFSLVGCTVSPGFEFSDFELGSFQSLKEFYPQHDSIIKQFTCK